MTGIRILILTALGTGVATIGSPVPRATAADIIAVCPTDFRSAVEPWLEHRRGEGLELRLLPSQPRAETLRRAIAEASDSETRYVVLFGDAPTIGTPCDVAREIPILYEPTMVTAKWGSTPTLASDLLFGDFDRDGCPDAVVGRLPVDTSEQLRQTISRIMAYEQSDDFGPWRGKVQVVGGVGGFGAVTDMAIESVTRTLLTSFLPAETRASIAYASPGHLFFPSGDSFTQAIVDRYQHGSRFWVYAGHGQVTELDRVPRHATGVPVLDGHSVRRLDRPPGGSPIAVLLACYTGAIDASVDSFAEEMFLCEGGPIAVIAGSRVTMPYGNTTAAVGLIDAVFTRKAPRLGDAWLSALVDMHRETQPEGITTRKVIDALAAVVSPPGTDLTEERREHMRLYNLIGDPTLQLQHPQSVALSVPPSHASGDDMEIVLTSPVSGELTLSIDRPLGAVTDGDPNATTVAEISTRIAAGQEQKPKFRLPAGVLGPVIVRAFVSGEKEWATAAAKTIVLSR